MDLIIIFKILFKKKWLILGISFITAVTTLLASYQMKPKYISAAQLSTGFTTNEKIQVVDDKFNIRDAGIKFNNLIKTMESELVMSLLTYRLIMHDWTSETPFKVVEFEKIDKLNTPSRKDIQQYLKIIEAKYEEKELLSSYDPIENNIIEILRAYGYLNWQLLKKIKIHRMDDTDFLRIQCESENPLFSAFVVNALSEEFLRYDNSLKISYSSQSIEFFEKLVSDKKKEYEQKQSLFNSFISTEGVISKEIESGAIMDQIKEYEIKKSTYAADIQKAKLSIADIDKRLRSQPGTTSPSNTSNNEKIVELRNKINQLNKLYIEGGSNDPEIEKELSNLKSQLQKALSSLATVEVTGEETDAARRKRLMQERESFELELEIAENNFASIQSTIRNLRGAASGVANKEVALEALRKELDKANEEYLTALDRYNQERNKSLVSESTVRLIIKGQPSGHPESSKRLLFTALAGIGSLLFTCLVIVLIEFLDQRLKNPTKFKSIMKIPLTGVLPFVKIKDFDLSQLFSDNCNIKDNEIFREFLRKIRFFIEKEEKKVFLITSTKRGEGKSFIIFCLAFSLSLIKKKILIIDTNFKNNTLTQMLLLKNGKQGKIDASNFFQTKLSSDNKSDDFNNPISSAPAPDDDFGYTDHIIANTLHSNIHIIGNQKGNASPSEIFAGKDFHKMLEYLKTKYDVILMEGPAFNDYSDARELVDYCEKALVVFSAESTISSIDKEGIDFLRKLNGKLMGAVLNKVEPEQLAN
jgi:polysaccharide biosynthesis transport protein